MNPWMLIAFLATASLALSTHLLPWFQGWSGSRTKSADILTVVLGDSRKLFAQHFYVKADAYFHSGYYPTIFDHRDQNAKLHIAATQSGEKEGEGEEFLGQPRDWIDRFSRHFYPTHHQHLGEHAGDHEHEGAEHHSEGHGDERELLPWLKLSAELDPQRPETYVVTSFWLRSHLGNVAAAEHFLRQGLQANPGHYEILFELGRIYYEDKKDKSTARNLWELALRDWHDKRNLQAPDMNRLTYLQILGQLARLEEEEKNYSKSIQYLEELKPVSPNWPSIEKWIEELKQKNSSPKS